MLHHPCNRGRESYTRLPLSGQGLAVKGAGFQPDSASRKQNAENDLRAATEEMIGKK